MAPVTNRIRMSLRKLGVDIARYPARLAGQHLGRDLQGLCPAAPVVFDVGARDGDSVSFFRELFPRSVIHSFEPSPRSFAMLARSTAGLDHVYPNQAALGSQPGRLPLLENVDSYLSSILEPLPATTGAVTGSTVVDVDTVDGYCRRVGVGVVDILKIDTQGYDLEVLRGAAEMLDGGHVKAVVIEITFADMYKDAATPDEIYRFAIDHGFRLMGCYGAGRIDGLAGWTDALFLHRSMLPLQPPEP